MSLPPDHSLRRSLNAEIHARPSPHLPTPSKISYLVLLTEQDEAQGEWRHMLELFSMAGVVPPKQPGNYCVLQFEDLWVIWESHTEFTRYTVIWTRPSQGSVTALSRLDKSWIDGLSGQTLLLSHCDLIAGSDDATDEQKAREVFQRQDFAGSVIADGAAAIFTDFEINADGSNYCLITDRSLTSPQAGRNVIRILEIYTYWLMALLALPVARKLSPYLTEREEQIRGLSRQLSLASSAAEETELLAVLTQLEAQLSEVAAQNDFRFAAAQAYYDLVKQRVDDLREQRIDGLQSIREFSQKRLAPAMQTCRSIVERQESLNVHTSRVARLLATRIDVNVQGQNREVLRSLDNRAEVQLRLQKTVEGLSIAAITYYLVGLVKYAAGALHSLGFPVAEELIVGGSIPVILLVVGLSIQRLRNRLDESARAAAEDE